MSRDGVEREVARAQALGEGSPLPVPPLPASECRSVVADSEGASRRALGKGKEERVNGCRLRALAGVPLEPVAGGAPEASRVTRAERAVLG